MSSSSRITRRWSPDTSSSLANWSFSACSMSRFALSNFSVVESKSFSTCMIFLPDCIVSGFENVVQLRQFVGQRVLLVLSRLFQRFQLEHLLLDGLHSIGCGFFGFGRHFGG